MATATLDYPPTVLMMEHAARKPRERLRESNAFGNHPVFEELREVWQECRKPGWDGHGATPVERAALEAAYRLLDMLPLGFPRPSISAQPDGLLTLEWYRTPTRNFSISIDPIGCIHYAGLFGADEHYGTVAFFDGLPERILRLASEV